MLYIVWLRFANTNIKQITLHITPRFTSSSSPFTSITSLMAEPPHSGSLHVAAIPYPGRGHINPMINLCTLIAHHHHHHPSNLLITLIVTEEWLTLIEPEVPTNVRFATVPNVIPSEVNRAADFAGFINAVMTEMEGPVEVLLRRMEVPVSVIVYDSYLVWGGSIGNRMKIPVVSFFTMSVTVFAMSYYYDRIVENGNAGDNFSGNIKEIVDYIPGVSPIRVADLMTSFNGKGKEVNPIVLKAILMSTKAQFLLFASIYELEARVIDELKSELLVPVYTVGPAIPYFRLNDMQIDQNAPEYIKWLDRQPPASVLYISQGSFLSVSDAQLEEIIAGVHDSGVRYMWIARGEKTRFKYKNDENDEKGLVISWCDQLRVLCHGSVGAFWSHCGWNSTKEGAFSGVPMLTCPIFFDQVPNSKMIVEDWKMGRRVPVEEGLLVTREEISKLVKSFMDRESEEGKEMRKRAKEVKKICQQAIAEGGSAMRDIDSFINEISKSRTII